jgi:hypothetical protein
MSKTDEKLKASEDFIRGVLKNNFNQTVEPDKLRAAAERLCNALPEKRKVAA